MSKIQDMTSQSTDLAPYVASMFINESLSRISRKQLRYNDKPDVFFAIESFLQNVTPIAVGSKVNDTAPKSRKLPRKR